MDPLDDFHSLVQEEGWMGLLPEIDDVLDLCPEMADVVLWDSYPAKSSPLPPPPFTLTLLTPPPPPPPPPFTLTLLTPPPPPFTLTLLTPPLPHPPLTPPSLTPLTVLTPPPPLPPLTPLTPPLTPPLTLLTPPPLPPLPPLWCSPAPPSTGLQSDRVPFLMHEGNNSFHSFGERDWDGVVAAVPSEALELVPVPKKRKREEDKGTHIKKPPNAFMLFLKSERMTVQEELGIRNSAVVNKVLSERWKSLAADKRDVFKAKAAEDARTHALNNPGWSNKANYGKNSKKCRTKAPPS